MTIQLSNTWPLTPQEDYKVHFAFQDGSSHPLDVWVRSPAEWQKWQEYWPGRNDFNRPFIFSLMQFYPEPDSWLFGGIYKVLGCVPGDGYDVELTDIRAEYIGRLKIGSSYRSRTRRVNLENHWESFEFRELLHEPYTGRSFPGVNNIDLSFSELETLVRIGRPDWKAALSSTKGVYLITDASTNLRYVGSAYGDLGIWSRWCDYAATGHGGNVEL